MSLHERLTRSAPQARVESVAFTAGKGVVTFPVPYSSAPVVVAQVVLATNLQQTQHIYAVTATGFEITAFRNGAPENGVSRMVSWIAYPET